MVTGSTNNGRCYNRQNPVLILMSSRTAYERRLLGHHHRQNRPYTCPNWSQVSSAVVNATQGCLLPAFPSNEEFGCKTKSGCFGGPGFAVD